MFFWLILDSLLLKTAFHSNIRCSADISVTERRSLPSRRLRWLTDSAARSLVVVFDAAGSSPFRPGSAVTGDLRLIDTDEYDGSVWW